MGDKKGNKGEFGQPLMIRKDYGDTGDTGDKKKETSGINLNINASMFKAIPIDKYDDTKIKKLCEIDWEIEDYDEH